MEPFIVEFPTPNLLSVRKSTPFRFAMESNGKAVRVLILRLCTKLNTESGCESPFMFSSPGKEEMEKVVELAGFGDPENQRYSARTHHIHCDTPYILTAHH